MVTYFDVTIAISCPHCYKWLCLVTVAPFHRPLYFLFSPFSTDFLKMSKANLFPTAVGPKPCAAGHMGPQVCVLPERWDTEPTPLSWRTERGKAAAQSGPQVSVLPERHWVYYPQTEGRRGKLQPDTGGLKFLSYVKDGTPSPPPSHWEQRGESCSLNVGLNPPTALSSQASKQYLFLWYGFQQASQRVCCTQFSSCGLMDTA